MLTVRTFKVEKIELMRVGSRQEAQPGQVVGVQVGDQYQACQDGPDKVVGIPLTYKTGREVEKVYDASGPEGKGYRVILSHANLAYSGDVVDTRYSCGNRSYVGYPGPVVVTVREVKP